MMPSRPLCTHTHSRRATSCRACWKLAEKWNTKGRSPLFDRPLNERELRIYQHAYQKGMKAERRKWEGRDGKCTDGLLPDVQAPVRAPAKAALLEVQTAAAARGQMVR